MVCLKELLCDDFLSLSTGRLCITMCYFSIWMDIQAFLPVFYDFFSEIVVVVWIKMTVVDLCAM